MTVGGPSYPVGTQAREDKLLAEIERLTTDKAALAFQLDQTIANLSRNEAEVERLTEALVTQTRHLDNERQRLRAALSEISRKPVLVEDGEFGMERALLRCQQMARDVLGPEDK